MHEVAETMSPNLVSVGADVTLCDAAKLMMWQGEQVRASLISKKEGATLSLGDEQNLNDRNPGGVFDQNVQWFQDAKNNPAYANTIIYENSWGSQLSDQNLSDFIQQAKPDMMSFDT